MANDGVELVCFGRTCVDLYGEQLGAPLGGVESFSKYVGGSAANICVGTVRLGLRSAMLSRVGDEDLGRFVLDTFAREGVDTSLVQLDPCRPTAMVTLALRERDGFPRIFFYADSADLALEEELVELSAVRRAGALLLTGTMLSRPHLARLSLRLAGEVREAGGKVLLDADFRPVLWGLSPIGEGSSMSALSPQVADAYRPLLGLCDLVVGTEEELCAMAGRPERARALAEVRAAGGATVVVKSGAFGATAYPPGGEGVTVPGFAVEVLNTVGAGDGFMSGFVSRFLRDAPLEECLRAGNAGGAIVATRHGCMAAMPYAAELEAFLAAGGVRRPDDDPVIERAHRTGARRPTPERLFVLAVDHRWQLEEMADAEGADRSRLPALKLLLGAAFSAVAGTRPGCGILADERYGSALLEQMAGSGRVVFRAMDVARSRPVALEAGEEAAFALHRWPVDHAVKVNCYTHPLDEPVLADAQRATLARLARACRLARRELLVELQPPSDRPWSAGDACQLLEQLYAAGVAPEWWKLPPLSEPGTWKSIDELIAASDPTCRGVLVLGSTWSRAEVAASFPMLAGVGCVRGFAVGRAIFSDAARDWLAGRADDEEVVERVAAAYAETIDAWLAADRARAGAGQP